MKYFTATAFIIAAMSDSVVGMKSKLPNGSLFEQDLGYPDKDSTQFTEFGSAFGAADHTWTPEFCKTTFPGASMTNGAAFGDPCCTWTKGGKADFTVTTTPGKATECASSSTTQASTAGSTTLKFGRIVHGFIKRWKLDVDDDGGPIYNGRASPDRSPCCSFKPFARRLCSQEERR